MNIIDFHVRGEYDIALTRAAELDRQKKGHIGNW